MSSLPLSFHQAPSREEVDLYREYDRLITANMAAREGPGVPMPVIMSRFELGLYMVIHERGIPMTTHFDRSAGAEIAWCEFGERLIVNHVSSDLVDLRVRALIQRWDGQTGWISMFNTNTMQHFIASMEGEPPCDTVADLLWPIIQRFRERPPLAFFGWVADGPPPGWVAAGPSPPPPPPPPPSCPPWRSSKRRRL